jgi:hypothetical protein
MKNKFTIIFFILLTSFSIAQINTPLEKSGYSKLTSHAELLEYVKVISLNSKLIKVDTLAVTRQGKVIPVVKISKGVFAKDKSKLKVLIFAQQHGNEQSGKEGALLLIKYLIEKENKALLNNLDIAIVPQMNPEGSEKNERRNSASMDLNRNHLILTEPETVGLHKLFNKYLFEATMDVHEFYPYGETYKKYGYRSNSDVEVGTLTNINVSTKIRELSDKKYMPFIKKYFNDRQYSFFEYCPGGPPGIDFFRRSTFDINDGRQGFGILNSLSFIQEGKNGNDAFLDNIERRSHVQMTGMLGLLEFCSNHKDEIKKLVTTERNKLVKNNVSSQVAIQLDHFVNGTKLQLPLLSYKTQKDTVVTVDDYRCIVKSIYDISRPAGYLIPKKLTELVEWIGNHNIEYKNYKKNTNDKLEEYFIAKLDSLDFEGDKIVNPVIEVKETIDIKEGDYIFVPLNQLRNNLIVIALEPKSELGIVTYKKYENLLKRGENFPILRVVNRKSSD